MTTKLSHKDVTFYDGPASQHSVISKGAPYSNAGKGAWAPTFGWNNNSSAQTWDSLMAHTLHYYPVANDSNKLRVVTCYRATEVDKKDLAAFGYIYSWEDQAKYFLPWTAEKPIITTAHKPQTGGIIVHGPEEIQKYSKFSTMTDINVPIRPMSIYGNIANNDSGKMSSQAATSEHLFRKYLISERPNYVPGVGYVPFTDRSMEWRDALFSEGYNQDRKLEGIGALNLSEGRIHGATIYRKFIALSSDLISEAWKLAYAKGYRGAAAQKFADEYINNVIEHEMAHIKEREGLPEKVSEFNIRSMHGRVNAKRAASRQGKLEAEIYNILSKHWYATAEEFRAARAGRGASKLESIAEEAVKEAEEMGLEGKEAVNYISNRINEYTKNNASQESDSEKSRLEDTVNESATTGENNSNNATSNYAANKTEASEATDTSSEPANDNTSAPESQESQAA